MLEFYPVPTSLNSNGLMHHQHSMHHMHHMHHLNNNIDNNNQIDDITIKKSPTAAADCNNERTDIGSIKCEKNYEICEGCGQKIQDRYLMKISDASWHENCLACCYCGMQLNNTCHVRNSKLYCKIDYERIFSVKCTRCCNRILPNDMVMRPQHYIFHLSCFTCCVCCQPLQKGEQFLMRGGQLFCRHDFEKEIYLSQHCDDDLLLDDHHRPRDGRRGPKRPRTILTSAQRKQFKASFELSPKPCRKVREALAKDTGLSVRVVQVWFQNQRAKMKKMQRKAKLDHHHHNNNNTNNGDKNLTDKDDKIIKQESPNSNNSEHGGYLGLDSSYHSSSQPLNPNLPYSPDDYHGNSNDSFCSSDISLDGSNFDHLDEATSDTMSLHNLDIHSHGAHGHHNNNNNNNNSHDTAINNLNGHHNHHNINPIDKLYLMQNSYFNNTEQ